MTSSIVSNISAYYAQQNLKTASSKSSLAIARLSSGQRIINASDDVAALSIGTVLSTNISTLRTALTNTKQANSLLKVADGGLKNISDILQRQKALSVQANSGTLSDTERSYLNQEFQKLTDEIDRLVDNTKFNSVKLLDGSLSKAVDIATITNDGTSTSNANATVVTLTGAGANGDKITIEGVTVELTTSAAGTAGAEGKVVVGPDATGTITNIANFLNNKADARLAGLRFTAAAGVLGVAGGFGHHAGTYIVKATEETDGGSVITVANADLATTSTQDGLGVDRTFAIGHTTSSLLVIGSNANTNKGQAIDLGNVRNNEDFVGSLGEGAIGEFETLYTGTANIITASLKVGDITYISGNINLAVANATSVTFTGYNDTTTAGGTFTVTFRGTSGFAADSQDEADDVASALNEAFADYTFMQNRDVSTFYSADVIVDSTGEQIANLNNAAVDIRLDNFDSVTIESVKITAPEAGGTDSKIEIVVNGETYRSYAGLGTKIDVNDVISLGNENDQTKAITIMLGSTALAGFSGKAMVIDSQERADLVAAGLEKAFGIQDGKSKIEFQTGLAGTDAIGVEIKSAGTTKLFDGNNLDLLTAANAVASGEQIDKAIATITSLRADVGALQSRFNYAGANLEVSIQNQDAARGLFLDADISEESTNFANSQVLLQASISVLAQANLLPQNLLKLIG